MESLPMGGAGHLVVVLSISVHQSLPDAFTRTPG